MNALQLKALLLDQITFHKFGQHLAPNFKQAKNSLCDMSGQKRNISTLNTIKLIGMVYIDNKQGHIFESTIDKFGIGKDIWSV